MWKLNTGLPRDLEGIIYCFLEDPVQTLVVQEMEDISKFMGHYTDGSFAYNYFENIQWMDHIRNLQLRENIDQTKAGDLIFGGWCAVMNRCSSEHYHGIAGGWKNFNLYISQISSQNPP